MASFFKKIGQKLVDFFYEEVDVPSKKINKDDTAVLPKFNPAAETQDDDTDTTNVEMERLYPDSRDIPVDDINDSDYWWCVQKTAEENTEQLLDPGEATVITDEINKELENDEFPLIEIPENVMRTMQLLNSQDFDYSEVADLINHSPSMSGEFIRVINSSLFSRGVVVNNLRLALPRLGKENIKALLYMYSSKLNFAGDSVLKDAAVDVVEHSYATALIAGYMSQRYYPDPDGAFLAGLMHDIGKLGILKVIAQKKNLLPKEKMKGEISLRMFDNIVGPLHPKAGVFLASRWKLDNTIIGAIEHHHDYFDVGFAEEDELILHLSALINMSDAMARMLGKGLPLGNANIFNLPATIDLALEKNHDTINFLENIPKIINFKMPENE